MIIRNIFKGKTLLHWSLPKPFSCNFSMIQMQEPDGELFQRNIFKNFNEEQCKPFKSIVLDSYPTLRYNNNISDFNEQEIYQMAFKKKERAKRKRRRRKYGSKTSARWK